MSEHTSSDIDLNHQYIAVDSGQLGLDGPQLVISDNATPLSIPKIVESYSTAFEDALNRESRPLNTRIINAINLAENIITTYAKNHGLAHEIEEIRYYSLPQDTHLAPRVSGGFISPYSRAIVLLNDSIEPDYYVAAKAFHELVHQLVDRKVIAYWDNSSSDYWMRMTKFIARRIGAQVQKLQRDSRTGKIVGSKYINEFINELGNFAWQKNYIQTLLSDSSLAPQFEDERAVRDQTLEKLFGKELDTCVVFPYSNGKTSDQYYIDRNNLYISKSGDVLVNSYALITQCVSDLTRLVPNVEGIPFASILVRIKYEPEKQNALRKAIDAQLGKGFFDRLRKVQYQSLDSVAEVLVEIQQKVQSTLKNRIDKYHL